MEKDPKMIQLLSDHVARKIAAGEVIERPSSVARELIDNAIDARGDSVSIAIEEGGIKRLRVVDNGIGMSREDIEICHLPHATSKISSVEDLLKISSLGFRGEALASIAACSRLTISSSRDDSGRGHRLVAADGRVINISECGTPKGTIVEMADLFYSYPARRHFLKRPSTEAAGIRKTLNEKALAFPKIEFSLNINGQLRLHLPSEERIERLPRLYGELDLDTLDATFLELGNISAELIAAPPAIYRRDRRLLQVYVNNRRIDDQQLTQAIRIGFDTTIPGGTFPVAFLFLSVPTDMIDFNIHPAKREARFRDAGGVAAFVRTLVRNFCDGYTKKNPIVSVLPPPTQASTPPPIKDKGLFPGKNTSAPSADKTPSLPTDAPYEPKKNLSAGGSVFYPPVREDASEISTAEDSMMRPDQEKSFLYIGQTMNLYLLAEQDGVFYIIDQHAAHERLLYDRFAEEIKEPQPLLVPYELSVEKDQEEVLKARQMEVERVGIRIRREKKKWHITALPAMAHGVTEEVAELIVAGSTNEELKKEFFARISCRGAIKQGDPLDDISAAEFLHKVFGMKVLRCPHGRPFVAAFTKRNLHRLFGREF